MTSQEDPKDFTWSEVLSRLIASKDLNYDMASWALEQILEGNASSAQIAGFVVALRSKGESVEEIKAMSDVMLAKARPIDLPREAVDIVGTGGDRARTVNISTMAAIVVASAGAKVIKHGNRAASSACGTADCLEALGIALSISPEAQQTIFDRCSLVFLFAPEYHSSLRHAAPARKDLGISTTFNFLGPLVNPARPRAQAIGVIDERMAQLIAQVIAYRGDRGLVFCGMDGLDELTTTSTSSIWMICEGQIKRAQCDPQRLGIRRASVDDIRGGDAQLNAKIVKDLLDGACGPIRDIVALNAAAALCAYRGIDMEKDIHDQLAEPYQDACEALSTHKAALLLERWRQSCSELEMQGKG